MRRPQVGTGPVVQPTVVGARDRPGRCGATAFHAARAGPAHLGRGAIDHPATSPGTARGTLPMQDLAFRAPELVLRQLVDERVTRDGALLPAALVWRDAGPNRSLLQRPVIQVGAVLGVGYYLGEGAPGGPLMLLEQPIQQVLVGNPARRGLDGGDDARPSAVHADMGFVVEAQGYAIAPHQLSIGIGAADGPF